MADKSASRQAIGQRKLRNERPGGRRFLDDMVNIVQTSYMVIYWMNTHVRSDYDFDE